MHLIVSQNECHEKYMRNTDMKIFSMIDELVRRLLEPGEGGSASEAWQRDPLNHPVIAAMSLREQADLPLGRASAGLCIR